MIEKFECIEGVAELRFVVVIVDSNISLFEGLGCDEFVVEIEWYKMFLVV